MTPHASPSLQLALRPPFPYHLPLPQRFAILGPPFRPQPAILQLPTWDRLLLDFDPQALALTRAVFESRPAWTAVLHPTHAVVLLTRRPGELTRELRDQVWNLWQVPALEGVLDSLGRVAAYECEAGHGWHLLGRSTSSPCPCGTPAALLTDPTQMPTGENDVILPLSGLVPAAFNTLRMWRNWQTRRI